MSVVAHLVGLEQIGYEKELGLNLNVSGLRSSHTRQQWVENNLTNIGIFCMGIFISHLTVLR
jgi:hypothetical protein